MPSIFSPSSFNEPTVYEMGLTDTDDQSNRWINMSCRYTCKTPYPLPTENRQLKVYKFLQICQIHKENVSVTLKITFNTVQSQ